jgi:hypothetical protein
MGNDGRSEISASEGPEFRDPMAEGQSLAEKTAQSALEYLRQV